MVDLVIMTTNSVDDVSDQLYSLRLAVKGDERLMLSI